ncbi:trypsin-like peptidase domain-containing protein, partial [Actinoallomurus rhizosphaericola]|uniref:trypsin-like peptidase domain-containing protein n=1 Tax=Actinoallomurus rhizosphaericola TaxID=2952536 RepID=UPI002091E0E1
MIDKARVAEVLVRHAGKIEYGSGYRISSRLILTASHLLKGRLDAACTVILGGSGDELSAVPAWCGAGRDVALLRLDVAVDTVPPVILGRLPAGVGSIPFVGVGFPAFAQRPKSDTVQGLQRRDSRQVDGLVQLGSNIKSGLLDLTFITAPPRENGPDGPDPWVGISGAALFAKGGFLIGVQTHRLPAAGTGSAEAESVAAALNDPEFARLLALNGVKTQAAQVSPPEHEPQNPLRSVVSQDELIEGFGDFKKYLTTEQLPFVSPGDHPAAPENVFVRLMSSGNRGVLLVGAAGTGKTRIGIEVGRLAQDAGWRVLHILPGEDTSVTGQIAEQVCAERRAVLLVIDYLNESLLDLSTLRHQLIPEANRRGIPIALLAAVRPGWLQKANRALLHELFDEVELRQDVEFQRSVAENALTTLAPTALQRLGKDRLMAICGHRPIVALLVAREIERRVKKGLAIPETAGLRTNGELPGWLERRLAEDGLIVPGREDTFNPARPSHTLIAAAAAAAACPQSREAVERAAEAVLAGATETVPEAEGLVATLVSLGWLETTSGSLSIAHDLVADQLMDSVFLPEHDASPNVSGIKAMLSGCLASARTMGRYAVNIGRLINDMTLADRAVPVIRVLDAWFAEHSAAIGSVLRRDADIGSYALGAICSGPPWSPSVVRCWKQAVNPWLADFGTSLKARHLLYRGLRYLPTDGALLLVPTALTWLSPHATTPEAGFVLGPLLSRTDLTPKDAERAITAAFTWLTPHATTPEAGFVLGPLLSRTDLTPKDAERAITAAFTWLTPHATTPEAGFVLGPLLSRTDLTPKDAERAITAAFTWLTPHAT